MARSTKLDRLITDPLNTRLTTAEAKVATIETRDLVELGDNISGLNNDAGYQNATQVDAKITAVVGAAPAALDTLGEIAAALADDDSAIAALVAQDTANATAITAIQSVNTTQDTAIANLTTDIAALEASLAIPTKQAITTSVEIFIDNVNGSDATANPTVNTTPCKTFAKALQFVVDNYYFTEASNNYLYLTLISNYTFSPQETGVLDGSNVKGFKSLFISSIDSTPKEISSSYLQPFIVKNFGYNLKFLDLIFTSDTRVLIDTVRYINFNNVIFTEFHIDNSEECVSSGITVTFDSSFDNVRNIYFGSQDVVKAEIKIANAFEVNFGGIIADSNGRFKINNIYYCSLIPTVFLDETFKPNYYSEQDYPIFELRDISEVRLASSIRLDSTTGINARRFFDIYDSRLAQGNELVFNNTHTSSIINKRDGIIRFNNCQINTLNPKALATSFKPVFTAENASKNLIELKYSNYQNSIPNYAGLVESTIATEVYSSTSRFIGFDKFSEFLGENILDLRGRITRRTITADITLSASDTSKQNIINQSGASRNVGLPSTPAIDQEFEVINHSTSTHNIIFAGETLVPGTRHAVQWDSVEWVIL